MFDLPQLEKDVGAVVSASPKTHADWLKQNDAVDNSALAPGSSVTTGKDEGRGGDGMDWTST